MTKDMNPLEQFVFYYAPTGSELLFAQNLKTLLEWYEKPKDQNTSP